MNQITIFDLIEEPKAAPVFPGSDFSEIVEYIGQSLGIEFKPHDKWEGYYIYKFKNGLKLEIHESRYSYPYRNGEPFISVGHDYKLGGGGSPSDTIEQAIKYFKYVIDVCR